MWAKSTSHKTAAHLNSHSESFSNDYHKAGIPQCNPPADKRGLLITALHQGQDSSSEVLVVFSQTSSWQYTWLKFNPSSVARILLSCNAIKCSRGFHNGVKKSYVGYSESRKFTWEKKSRWLLILFIAETPGCRGESKWGVGLCHLDMAWLLS